MTTIPQAPAVARTLAWKKSPLTMALDPEAKVAACRAALADGRATAATALRLLEALFETERFEEGIAFARANPRPPGETPAWDVACIHVLLGAGRKEEALAHTEAALGAAGDHGELLRERAELLVRLRRDGTTEAAVLALLERSDRKLTPSMTNFLDDYWAPDRFLALLDRHPDRFLPGEWPYRRMRCLRALGRLDEVLAWMDVDGLLHRERPGFPDAFNATLLREIVDTASFRRDPFDTSTRRGLQTDILLNGGPCAPALLAAVRTAIDRYVARLRPDHPFATTMPATAALEAWMVRLGLEGRQASHIHPSGWLSGVYYVTAPEVDETAGALVIPSAADPPWPVRTLVPEAGLLVLFPSYFKHYTLPHGSPEPRVCVAFDVLPRG